MNQHRSNSFKISNNFVNDNPQDYINKSSNFRNKFPSFQRNLHPELHENTNNLVSPIILKRSSLIKYDDVIPFADSLEEVNIKVNEENLSDIQAFDVQSSLNQLNNKPFNPIFKTGSISSLKVSSLTEYWPSSEFVKGNKGKIRTHSTSDKSRKPLPSDNTGEVFFSHKSVPINGNKDLNNLNSVNTSNGSLNSRTSAEIAKDLLSDKIVLSNKTTIASYLSNCDPDSKSVALEIMKQIDFTNIPLVESLQIFNKKVSVIGESQERDRILMHFSNRYMACNNTAYKNTDACHTIVCAIMLLNTDLHGQVSKRKMTCKEFIDNLLTNFPENQYKENDLISIYNYIKKNELKNNVSDENTNTIRRRITNFIIKPLKLTQDNPIVNMDSNLLNLQQFISGNIMRKCIKKSFGKRPGIGHRGWKLQFASLIGLQMLLFKTNLNENENRTGNDEYSDRVSLTDSNLSSDLLHNDNSSVCLSINHAAKSMNSKLPSSCSRENLSVSVEDVDSCIKIHHSFAAVVEKLKHKNIFSLKLADQAEYFFKVKTDQLNLWVNNINYAAALLSAPPIVGAGQCGFYKPLMPGYLTDLDKNAQIKVHENQLKLYEESLKRLQLANIKSRTSQDENIKFCQFEINRFDTYINLLKSKSLQDLHNNQLTKYRDIESVISNIEPSNNISESISVESPRSLFSSFRNTGIDEKISVEATLRRRPPKISTREPRSESVTRTQTSSNHPLIQLSPTSDSLQKCFLQNYYIPSSVRPVSHSPQIGSFSHLSLSSTPRPIPSFSRFVDPSCANHYQQSPTILSPLTTARTNHSFQHVIGLSRNQLPRYSPPNIRKKPNPL